MARKNNPAFFDVAYRLKDTPRSGWLRRNLAPVESVADHSYAVALLAFVLADELDADRTRLVELALLHDLPESIVGDITPLDSVSRKTKARLEHNAARTLAQKLHRPEILRDAFAELEASKTRESKLVHELDKLDLAIQAKRYERKTGLDLAEFLEYADRRIRHPVLRKLLVHYAQKPKKPLIKKRMKRPSRLSGFNNS